MVLMNPFITRGRQVRWAVLFVLALILLPSSPLLIKVASVDEGFDFMLLGFQHNFLINELKSTLTELSARSKRVLCIYLDGLIEALGDKFSYVRCNAAEGLGRIKDPISLSSLINALGDPHEAVRSKAAWSLGEIGDRRALWPLIIALNDSDGQVRAQSALALGKIGDMNATIPLIQALKDKDAKESAARALGAINDPKAVDILIKELRMGKGGFKEGAALALGYIGDPKAIIPLIQSLKYGEPEIQVVVAIALGLIEAAKYRRCINWGNSPGSAPSSKITDALIRALKDNDSTVRAAVASVLGEIGDPQALNQLVNALRDKDGKVRMAAVQAIESIGKNDSKVLEILVYALKEEDSLIRAYAARAIGILSAEIPSTLPLIE
jgi:HEAT repeat protein